MRIVVVEDNAMLARGIVQALGDAGHSVDWLDNGEAGAAFLADEGADVVILDINLPGRNGLDVLRGLRARGDATPVLMLTARAGVGDRVTGLDAGADDYLAKPFDMTELSARVRALGRRGPRAPVVERIGVLSWNRAAGLLDGLPADQAPTRRELALFEALFEHRDRVLSKDALCARLYGTGADIETNAVELLVSRLRRKLAGSGVTIRTIRGLGYLLQEDAAA